MTRIFSDLDYFLSKDKIVYLVKGYYHPSTGVFATPVFWPDPKGQRVHQQWGTYTKQVSDVNNRIFKLHPEYAHTLIPRQTPLVLRKDIQEVFHPREKIKQFKKEMQGSIWHAIFQYLVSIMGVKEKDIGIFGSYLVNLHQDKNHKHLKDVDFVIYGRSNLSKVKENIGKLIKHFHFSHISKEHIRYHQQKFGNLFDPKINSLEKTLANKWLSIQVAPGLLNTLRFVYQINEIPPNPITVPIKSFIKIKGVVIDDFDSNFVPRVFSVKTNAKIYQVVTYFWVFQACVKKGNQVLITGNLHQDEHTISIDNYSHGIKIFGT